MMGRSEPQGLVGKFFIWPFGEPGDITRMEGEVVQQVDPEHYLIRFGEAPGLFIVPLKVMVSRFGERIRPEEGSPRYAWEFYETRGDRERVAAEREPWQAQQAELWAYLDYLDKKARDDENS